MLINFVFARDSNTTIMTRKDADKYRLFLFLLPCREALEISLKNVGRSDIKKEKDRDNYRTKVQ